MKMTKRIALLLAPLALIASLVVAPGTAAPSQATAAPARPPVVSSAPHVTLTAYVAPVAVHAVVKAKPKAVLHPYGPSARVRLCIVTRESHGNYKARRHDGGTSSGAYQIIDKTWHHYKGYAHAWQAPKKVQDAKFYKMWKYWVTVRHSKTQANPWFFKNHRQCY